MKEQLIIREYQGNEIEIAVNGDVMINANEMAKPFGKLVKNWLRLDSTKRTVEALCQSSHLSFENEFSPTGRWVRAQVGGKNPGTWLHRYMAIDFAMWLSPEFKVWILQTIDEILSSRKMAAESFYTGRGEAYRAIKKFDAEIAELHQQLRDTDVYKTILAKKAERASLKKRLQALDRQEFTGQQSLFDAGEGQQV